MTHASRMAEIKAREAAATEGPWYCEDWKGDSGERFVGIRHDGGEGIDNVVPAYWYQRGRGDDIENVVMVNDYSFCAEARADIPYLLARVEALEALVEAAYCEGYEDSKDHGSHWSNSVSRAALEGE